MEVKDDRLVGENGLLKEDVIKAAYAVSLVDFAGANGIELENGDSKTFRVKDTGSLYIFKHGHGYVHFSTGEKGNIVDFVKDRYGLDFKQAIGKILSSTNQINYTKPQYQTKDVAALALPKEAKKDLVLPPHAPKNSHVFAYLINSRKIDKDIVFSLVGQKKIYEAISTFKDKQYNVCAFVGTDENKTPKYCCIRSTNTASNFRQDIEGSIKNYGWKMDGISNRAFIFESPIDAMSHATIFKNNGMDYKTDTRLSCGGLNEQAIQCFLNANTNITHLIFCFDNDITGKLPDGTPHNHGQIFAEEMFKKYRSKGFTCDIAKPTHKDFNEDLTVVNQPVVQNHINTLQKNKEKAYEQEV